MRLKLTRSFQVRIDPRTFRNAIAQRAMYDKTINQCINLDLKENYELMGYTQLDYCLTSEDKIKLDFLDLFFSAIVASLVIITISSSYYDKSLQKTRATPEEQRVHYKLSVAGPRELIDDRIEGDKVILIRFYL